MDINDLYNKVTQGVDEKWSDLYKMRYIYLIQSLDDGFYKIGLSKHPNKRLNQLQTGNSSKLKLVEIYQSEFANLIEKTLPAEG